MLTGGFIPKRELLACTVSKAMHQHKTKDFHHLVNNYFSRISS